jgi:hypothetical protein
MKSTSTTAPETRSTQPSSLTRRGARSGAECPSCGSQRLTALAMTLTDGTLVNFSSCHNCEHRVWADNTGRMDITDVLNRATKRKAS